MSLNICFLHALFLPVHFSLLPEVARIRRRWSSLLSLIFRTCQMSKNVFSWNHFSLKIFSYKKHFTSKQIKPSSYGTGPTRTSSSNFWNYQISSHEYILRVWLFKLILRCGWCPRFCVDSKSHTIISLSKHRIHAKFPSTRIS